MLLWQMVLYAQPQQPTAFAKGYQYLIGMGRPLDQPKAVGIFKAAAANGDPECLNALGNLYAQGQGVGYNIDSAINCYKMAAQKGYASGYYNLGRLYQQGTVVAQDFVAAANYYKQGAALGHEDCKSWLAYLNYKGIGTPQNYNQAFDLYQELANKGNANAMYFVGICYRNGYGTPANAELAKQWLKKAADGHEAQAVTELYSETLPENKSVVSNALQEKLATLKTYHENVATTAATNISGNYVGQAVYYDFSGKYVQEIVPLKLTLEQNTDGYKGTWVEGDSLAAPIGAKFYNNQFVFDSACRYTRHNRYSFGTPEAYRFNNASLGIKYLADSMYLAGDVQFYSLGRREPGQPMYISVSKKIEDNGQQWYANLPITVSPNPATSVVNASFTLGQGCKVTLQITTMEGRPLPNTAATKTLPAGSYNYPFNVEGLAAGSYIITIDGGNTKGSKIFIKL